MIIRVISFCILFFAISSTCFSNWKENFHPEDLVPIEQMGDEYVNIYGFRSFLNENGEYVLEYPKKRYDSMMRVYGGKNILGWDPKNTGKYNLNFEVDFQNAKVFITIKNDTKLQDMIQFHIKREEDFFLGKNVEKSNDILLSYYTIDNHINSINLFPHRDYSDNKNIDNSEHQKTDIAHYIAFVEYIFYDIGDIKSILKYYESNPFAPKIQNGNIVFTVHNWNQKNNEYKLLQEKYKNNYKGGNHESIYKFSLQNKNILKDFIWDILIYFEEYFIFTFNDNSQISQKYMGTENQILVSEQSKDIYLKYNHLKNPNLFIDHIASKNKDNTIYSINCQLDQQDLLLLCNMSKGDKGVSKEIQVNKINYPLQNNEFSYINMSQLAQLFDQNIIPNNLSIGVSHGEQRFQSFYFQNYIYQKDSILDITSHIKSPRNISTNPYLISINAALALIYLLVFYFTSQLFNAYFEELSVKHKWNESISKFLHSIFIQPIKKISTKFDSEVFQKIKIFFGKYEHKIYIIFGFIMLGIIGQIVADDFDILSLQGWGVIGIMILIIALSTLLKDIILYIYNKKNEKENLKLRNIPIGFIFAFCIALFGRFIGLIPGVMFGSAIKVDTKYRITERKISKSDLLLKILAGVFGIGILVWLISALYNPDSFTYKFLLVTYFGLINDVFFNLLPFGLLWGTYIVRNKQIRAKWFIFMFIVFFFLLHTVLHGEGDLKKLLEFDGNFFILVLILIFWILLTGGLFYYLKKSKKVM